MHKHTQQKPVVALIHDLQLKGHKDNWDRAINVENPIERFNMMSKVIDKFSMVGDAIKTFEIVKKAGRNDAELCTYAAAVSAAFLSVRYEDQYKDIKNIENAYCRHVGLPR